PRPRAPQAAPACGACSPASAAPASSAGRCCLSFRGTPLLAALITTDGGIDDLAVEQVDEVLHEPVRAHRARRLGTPRFALAVLDGGRAGARGLAHRDLHRDAAAEMLLESRLQLVLV